MAELKSLKFLTGLRLRYVILLTLLFALLLFLTAFFSIEKSKSNMLKVMEKEGKALLESLVLASQNTVKANSLLEELVTERLLDVAKLVDQMDKDGILTNSKLEELVRRNSLSRIDLLDINRKIFKSSHPEEMEIYADTAHFSFAKLEKVLKGEIQETAFEIKGDGILSEGKYVVVLRRSKGQGGIAVISPTAYMENFQKEIGIGYLIQNISQQSGIEYIVLQSREGIVFASKKVEKMLKLENDPFLLEALLKNETKSRVTPFEERKVLEVVKPFISSQFPSGIFRLGLSLEGYKQITKSYQGQMILFSLILFFLGLLFIGIALVNQSYFVLDKSYKEIRTLTGNVLEGMNNAVVAVDKDKSIIVFNPVAEELFSLKRNEVINKNYSQIFPEDEPLINQVLSSGKSIWDMERRLPMRSKENKDLVLGTSILLDEKGKIQGAVAVIHDMTELKKYEDEAKRAERLSILGNLAAGVAHEIRNPLNAISIAAQRLKSEFVPIKDKEEYLNFTQTILNEIKRLDQTINQFLSLAKVQKLNLVSTDMNSFFCEIISLMEIEAKEKGILIEKEIENIPKIRIDREEMKKATVNVILNGIQAMPVGGKMKILGKLDRSGKEVIIKIKDSGPGIPEENLSKIFQPYFTTKDKGTGLGLAIAYRIIADHKGKIEVESKLSEGTTFIIRLPV
ncbi:MAG TPA: ATP-binding protein [candidate division Zixibacteria bacterium]